MKTVLITGFESFGDIAVNPSWQAVQLLPETIDGARLVKTELPVTYGESGEKLKQLVEEHQPVLVVLTGAAGGRKKVTPEAFAINYRYAGIADNNGKLCRGEPILADGPLAMRTPLPVEAIVDACTADELPCALSVSAGAYVCNDLYYHLLQLIEGTHTGGLFIHVPVQEDLATEVTAKVLQRCVTEALKYCEKL